MKMATPAATLIRYLGDSALYADQLGNSLLVLDANGKVARVMSVPRSNDIPMLALSSQFGHPSLPKFSLTYERTLNEDLAALGMGIAFGDGADFSGLSSSPVYISSVKQKAFVDVNESGTEAAAATNVVLVASTPPSLDVDRPFIFVIRDRLSGTILFMGKMNSIPSPD